MLSSFHRILLTLALLHITSTTALTSDQGYTCDGMIIKKDPSSNDVSAANLICCEGDPHQAILLTNGPTSCTAGQAVPLTEEPKAGSGGTAATATTPAVGAAGTAAGQGATSANAGVPALPTKDPWIGVAVAAWGVLAAI